jgi:hypothetical protein
MGARRLQFHGFIFILVSFGIGLLLPALGPTPRGRLFLGAHTTGLMMGLLLITAGAVWPNLRLGPRAQKVARLCLLAGAWVGLLFLGIFGSVMQVPAIHATPNLPAPPAWVMAVFGSSIAIVSITLTTAAILFVVGLRPVDGD